MALLVRPGKSVSERTSRRMMRSFKMLMMRLAVSAVLYSSSPRLVKSMSRPSRRSPLDSSWLLMYCEAVHRFSASIMLTRAQVKDGEFSEAVSKSLVTMPQHKLELLIAGRLSSVLALCDRKVLVAMWRK
jgi:hypothetical protein